MFGVWLVFFTWGAIAVFLLVLSCRVLAMARLPLHLRWELAPIPGEKAKGSHGGSFLEEYEWWTRPRKKSAIDPLIYMAWEIFLLRGVWKHNRSLWPLSLALHAGLYLSAGALCFQGLSLILSASDSGAALAGICLDIASPVAFCAFLFGTLGAAGLLLKRALDAELRCATRRGAYFNLLLLAAVFSSGLWARLASSDAARDVDRFLRALAGFQGECEIASPLVLHAALVSLFLICLPFTSMIHFAAKYFTYHHVLWNDRPLDGRMERKVSGLLSQPVEWMSGRAGSGSRGSWAEIALEKAENEKTQP